MSLRDDGRDPLAPVRRRQRRVARIARQNASQYAFEMRQALIREESRECILLRRGFGIEVHICDGDARRKNLIGQTLNR